MTVLIYSNHHTLQYQCGAYLKHIISGVEDYESTKGLQADVPPDFACTPS